VKSRLAKAELAVETIGDDAGLDARTMGKLQGLDPAILSDLEAAIADIDERLTDIEADGGN